MTSSARAEVTLENDGRLVPFACNVWIAATPIRFAGIWHPHVMTVIKLADGNVILHSPCALSPDLQVAIERIGAVQHIIAPNWFHDLYLREYREAHPNATFWGPRFLQRQHPQLIDAVLSPHVATPWVHELSQVSLQGLASLDETLFFHVETRTLIAADFLSNLYSESDTQPFTRFAYKLFGLEGGLKLFPLLRWFGFTTRRSLQCVMKQIETWNPERVIVGHGDPIASHAKEPIRLALGSKA